MVTPFENSGRLATNRLGAVWVPVNNELRSATLKHVLRSSVPALAIVDSEFCQQAEQSGALESGIVYINGGSGVQQLDHLYQKGSPVETPVAVKPSTTAMILFSSGTTGPSKACMQSHEMVVSAAKTMIAGCEMTSEDVLFCPFPLFHVDATALTVVPAMLLGAVAALSQRFSAARFWDEIRSAKATVYDFMGATLALLHKQPPSHRDRDHRVRVAWGVPLQPGLIHAFETRFGHKLVTLYGSTEAGVPVFQQGVLATHSCGKVVAGYEARIADDDDSPLPVGKAGNLLIRAQRPNATFAGYFNDSASTAAVFRNLWLHTGDIAKLDEYGNLFFLGRIKDMIRRRGENVNAHEVEQEFLAHPEVSGVAAFGIPSQLGAGAEEDLKLVVSLRQGSEINEVGLWEWAKRTMARFQVPAVIHIVDTSPQTPTGKIEKHMLPKDGGMRFDTGRAKL